MAIFYRVVRNLVDFSLVTKLTKHVSKVRETVKKVRKTRRNDCETFFMTSDSQKMISRFLDSYFCTKFQISQPGSYPDQAIKIRLTQKLSTHGKFFYGVMRHVENLPDRHTEKKSRFVVFGPKRSPQIIWHDIMASKKGAKMTPHGQDFAWKYARYRHFRENFPKKVFSCCPDFSLSWVFFVFLHLCAVQVCFVDRDSILFLRKERFFLHYGKWESPKKYLFFDETRNIWSTR